MKWISDLIDLIFPRHCSVCGEILSRQERDICLNCLCTLPKIEPNHKKEIEQIFWGKIGIERAMSFMYYRKGSPYNSLMHRLKYKDAPEVGTRLAEMAAKELLDSGFFDGITRIVPLPLSKKKQRRRGYNQSEYIAIGLSNITGIPVDTELVKRDKANETQTHKNRDERWENVKGIFSVSPGRSMENEHVLLVDDILTTGATLCSCAAALQKEHDCRISIFTLAYTYNGF
ncbi:MAG: ComF family protein [Bacteroidaceae bacterium]|nr:ComF family protein [Bacteroidaceae bacterium]